jgi:hypothetical protein
MAEIEADASDVEVVTRPKKKKIRVELIRETISSNDNSEVSPDPKVNDDSPALKGSSEVSESDSPKKVVPKRKPRPRPGHRNRQKPVD